MAIARGDKTKAPPMRKSLPLFGLLLAAGLAFSTSGNGQSLPTGAKVAAGQATVSTAGSSMTVRQTSDRVALHWDSFSIGQGNSVRFDQPSATSVALNRVLGADPSVIQGAWSANGRVFQLNPSPSGNELVEEN
jgi:filamentous hemagglutinin family protein